MRFLIRSIRIRLVSRCEHSAQEVFFSSLFDSGSDDEEQYLKGDTSNVITTYNRPWSIREITFFIILILILLCVLLALLRRKRIVFSQMISILLLFTFLIIVLGSTVFTRLPGKRLYEPELFWSWKRVFFFGSKELFRENLLNLLLLLPIGIMLPSAFNHKVLWKTGLLAGIMISAIIETAQLISCRGLFEFDDIIHNGVGCVVGVLIGNMVWGWVKKRKQ